MADDLRYLPLQSSQIMGIAYDLPEKRLYTQFNNAAWYEYDDVPAETVLQVIIARSQGTAFNEKVKKGNFVYRKLDEEPDFHV